MSQEKGFTMMELLSAIFIVACLAAVAIPNFSRIKDRGDANQAIAYLRTIQTAQRIHFARNGEYACQTAANCDTAGEIKTVLPGTDVTMATYSFSVTATGTTFIATATRISDGVTIILWEDGTWHGTYTPLPTI